MHYICAADAGYKTSYQLFKVTLKINYSPLMAQCSVISGLGAAFWLILLFTFILSPLSIILGLGIL